MFLFDFNYEMMIHQLPPEVAGAPPQHGQTANACSPDMALSSWSAMKLSAPVRPHWNTRGVAALPVLPGVERLALSTSMRSLGHARGRLSHCAHGR